MPENIDDIVRLLQSAAIARPYVVGHYDTSGRKITEPVPDRQQLYRRMAEDARMTVEEIQPIQPEPQKIRVEIEGRNLDDL